MQQRVEASDSLDDFPTPPWATRALIRFLVEQGYPLDRQTAWEPGANRGYMALPLREIFLNVRASDVVLYDDRVPGFEPELIDFLTTGATEPQVDWVIANPPFRLAQEFITMARQMGRVGCAMFVRGAFTEGKQRYRNLFSRMTPDFELKFTERVVLLKERLVRANDPDPFNIDDKTGEPRKAASATCYVWLIWLREGDGDTRARWIAPCRQQLERDGDYPNYAAAFADLAASTVKGTDLFTQGGQ